MLKHKSTFPKLARTDREGNYLLLKTYMEVTEKHHRPFTKKRIRDRGPRTTELQRQNSLMNVKCLEVVDKDRCEKLVSFMTSMRTISVQRAPVHPNSDYAMPVLAAVMIVALSALVRAL